MENIPFVDLKAQYNSIKTEIDTTISNVIEQTAFIGGEILKKFEDSFAQFCGVKHCIGVGNGTDAIFLALKSLGIGKGDEVITSAFSFIATSEAISMAGAKPVFVDINPVTYTIDVTQIESKITERTKAVIPVHLYGRPAEMSPIRDLAERFDLRIIEDAAQAHGAVYAGKKIGSIGDLACFSFYPGKNLGGYGDGGAVVTDNDEYAMTVRKYANHGRVSKYDHEFEGVNSRLDTLQAAILSVKLKHLEKWTDGRISNARYYLDRLKKSGLQLPAETDGIKSVYHLFVVRHPDINRSIFMDNLKGKGISTGIHYPIALPFLKAYAYLNHGSDDFPEAYRASQQVVSLPMFAELKHSQIETISSAIIKCI
jgi:dTDP-4-amino-4,6-dideoxygalactose transaminase